MSVSVVLVSFAQLSLKFAMQNLPVAPDIESYMEIFGPKYLVSVVLPIALGLGSYVVSVLCWIGTLARLPLSMAYPSLALSYLVVYFGATLLPMFDESADTVRLVGIALVIAGVWLVSLPASRAAGSDTMS